MAAAESCFGYRAFQQAVVFVAGLEDSWNPLVDIQTFSVHLKFMKIFIYKTIVNQYNYTHYNTFY